MKRLFATVLFNAKRRKIMAFFNDGIRVIKDLPEKEKRGTGDKNFAVRHSSFIPVLRSNRERLKIIR